MKHHPSRRSLSRAAALTAALCTAVALAGCGLTGGEQSAASSDTSKNVSGCDVPPQNLDDSALTGNPSGKITFQTTNLKKNFAQVFDPMIAEFEKKYPGTEVEWIDDPGDDDFSSRMLAQARACSLPDVVNMPQSVVASLNQAGQLLDLSVKQPTIGDEFVPSLWESMAFSENATHPALPWYWSPSVLTFNTDLMTKAGLDPSKPPTSILEWLEQAKQIAAGANGEFYAMSGNITWNYMSDWLSMGVKVMNDDYTAFTFADDPNALAYIQGYADAYAAGAIPKDSVTGSPDPSQDYAAGKLVYGTRNASFVNQLKSLAPSIYPVTSAIAAPTAEGVPTPYNGQMIGVPNTTKNAVTAVAFAQFLTNTANQLAFDKDPSVVIFPTTSEALKDPFFTQGSTSTDPLEHTRAVAAVAAQDTAISPVSLYANGAVESAITKQLQLAIIGDEDPATALKTAQDDANNALAK